MRKLVATALALALGVGSALGADKTNEEKVQEKRAKIDATAKETLEHLAREAPNAKALLDGAYGYAAFDSTKTSLGIGGGGTGHGVAVVNATGHRTYMKMRAASVGLGVGVHLYQLVVVFEGEAKFRKFVDEGWVPQTTATAAAGGEGAGVQAAFVDGIAMYEFTDKGLMARWDVGAAKYSKNDKLN